MRGDFVYCGLAQVREKEEETEAEREFRSI